GVGVGGGGGGGRTGGRLAATPCRQTCGSLGAAAWLGAGRAEMRQSGAEEASTRMSPKKRKEAPPADLFNSLREAHLRKAQPLAARMRPRTLDEFVGQEHFLGPGKLLRRL